MVAAEIFRSPTAVMTREAPERHQASLHISPGNMVGELARSPWVVIQARIYSTQCYSPSIYACRRRLFRRHRTLTEEKEQTPGGWSSGEEA